MRRVAVLAMCIGLLGLGMVGCEGFSVTNGVEGEGPLVTETRDVAAFTAIEVGGGVHVELTVGPERSVSLEAQQNILDILETNVRGKTLHLEPTDSYGTTRGVTLTITVPELDGVELSGGAIGQASGVNVDRLEVTVSGGAQLTANGEAGDLQLDASGGGQAHLGGLQVKTATISVSGGSTAELNASDSVSGSASGGAQVHVAGDATVSVDSSGGSQVD